MTIDTISVPRTARTPDRLGAALGAGFVVLLIGSESALVLPDVGDSATAVAAFYVAHRALAIALQLIGLLASALLFGYAWRLRSVDRTVGLLGMVAAVCSLAPTLMTLILAVLADPAHPGTAGTWNALIPRGDDVLFLGVVLFSAGVAWRLRRSVPGLAALAALVSLACLARLVLEALGRPRGALESVGPLSFVILVAVMAVLSVLGVLRLRPHPTGAAETGWT